jgi:AmmeMemoRadiSam system protein A
MSFTESERQTLLDTAWAAIQQGLSTGRPMLVNTADYAPALHVEQASFVTLMHHQRLRGCIGSLQATLPLIVDVAQHAYAAAFQDPRFPPVQADELAQLRLHISVLNPPRPLFVSSEAELWVALRPGEDGVILQEGTHRSTFLPSVWDSLPAPVEFMRHLKQKAGLPPDYWSDSIKVWRYTTESVG